MGKLRIRLAAPAGLGSVPVLVEQLATGAWLQADLRAFAPAPAAAAWPPPPVAVPEAGAGRYAIDLDSSAWADGHYAVYHQEHAAPGVTRHVVGASIANGDDGPAPPVKLAVVGGTLQLQASG